MTVFNGADFAFVGTRLDAFLASNLSGFSRSRIQKMIKTGDVLVNRNKVKSGHILKENDEIYVKEISEGAVVLKKEKFDLDVLYEDDSCFVIDKPAGMIVHPGEGEIHMKGTIANVILSKVSKELASSLRPGIVHRLDKDTSGALVVAKTREAYEDLISQFKKRSVEKVYFALVSGKLMHGEGVIDSPIGRSLRNRKKMGVVSGNEGKKAITQYKVRKFFDIKGGKSVSLLELQLKTGRTHQIRVHFSAIGHPIVGDRTYGNRSFNKFFNVEFGLERQFLHAWKLKFRSPLSGKIVKVESKLPADLYCIIKKLK